MSEFDWAEVYEAAERCRNGHDGEIPADFCLFLPEGTNEAIMGMAEELFDRDVHESAGPTPPRFAYPTPYKHPFNRKPRTKAGEAMADFLQSMMGGGVTEEDRERMERIARTGEAGRAGTWSVSNEQIEYRSFGSAYRQTIRGQSVHSISFDEMKHLNPDLYEAIMAKPRGKKFRLTDITEA